MVARAGLPLQVLPPAFFVVLPSYLLDRNLRQVGQDCCFWLMTCCWFAGPWICPVPPDRYLWCWMPDNRRLVFLRLSFLCFIKVVLACYWEWCILTSDRLCWTMMRFLLLEKRYLLLINCGSPFRLVGLSLWGCLNFHFRFRRDVSFSYGV